MGFRARQIVALTLTAMTVAVATCLVNAAILVRMHVLETRERADLFARTLYHLASQTIRQHEQGDLREELAADPALRHYADAVVGYSPIALYVAIRDQDGVAILHSDSRQEGRRLARFETFAEFSKRSALSQLWVLSQEQRILSADLPFTVDGVHPFGSVVVAVSTLLLKRQLLGAVATNALAAGGAVLLAFLASLFVANRVLAPIERLRMELARIDPGEGQPPLDLRTEADVGRLVDFFTTVSARFARERHRAGELAWAKSMLDGLADAVIVFDRDRRVLSLNDDAVRLFGRSRSDLEAQPIDRLLAPDHPLRSLLDETLQRGEAVRSRTVPFSVEGRDVPYLLTAHVLRQGTDDTSGVMITARDLKRLSRLSSQLSYAQKLAALGRLTSGVAHEIRNPLNALVLHVTLLRQKLGDAHEARHHVDVVEEEVKRLDRVIDGFLKLTRPEEIHLESVRLDRIVQEAVNLMAPRAEQCKIRLESQAAPELPTVQGNAGLLRQVLLNLMSNAFDAMPNGGVLRVRAEISAERSVLLTLEDTGEGIAPEDLPKIFNLSYTTTSGGSGIGLSMVHSIIQLHGGDIRVESERGMGTRVTVTLPEVAA